VIQEHIKKPLADELLFGKLLHGGVVRVLVEGEGDERKLAFEYIPAEPKPKKAKGESEEDDGDDDEGEEEDESAALVEVSPRKALPGPRDKKDRPKSSGTVPSVPRRKDD
jgi:ATP-dependent Clp protease ATP-binding subunit ClpA